MSLLDTWSPCPMAPPLDPDTQLYEDAATHKYITRKLARELILNARLPAAAALATLQVLARSDPSVPTCHVRCWLDGM